MADNNNSNDGMFFMVMGFSLIVAIGVIIFVVMQQKKTPVIAATPKPPVYMPPANVVNNTTPAVLPGYQNQSTWNNVISGIGGLLGGLNNSGVLDGNGYYDNFGGDNGYSYDAYNSFA